MIQLPEDIYIDICNFMNYHDIIMFASSSIFIRQAIKNNLIIIIRNLNLSNIFWNKYKHTENYNINYYNFIQLAKELMIQENNIKLNKYNIKNRDTIINLPRYKFDNAYRLIKHKLIDGIIINNIINNFNEEIIDYIIRFRNAGFENDENIYRFGLLLNTSKKDEFIKLLNKNISIKYAGQIILNWCDKKNYVFETLLYHNIELKYAFSIVMRNSLYKLEWVLELLANNITDVFILLNITICNYENIKTIIHSYCNQNK